MEENLPAPNPESPDGGDGRQTGGMNQAPGRVAGAAGIMVATILLSRVLGLVRDMVVSYFFGAQASPVADAYRAAFRLPDLFYYLIAGGALSSAFIPVFTEYITKKDEENAWKVYSIFGTAITIALTVMIVLGELLAPWVLSTFIVPAWSGQKLDLTITLTRIIFPAQLCFFLGGLMMATLQVRQRFLMPALGPVVYNVFIILGGILGALLLGPIDGVYGLCWGVLIGAFLGNIVMQLREVKRVGVHYQPSLDLSHPGVKKVARLMLPVLLGLSLPQLGLILTTPFASYLPQGSVSWLDSAIKLMQLPLGIFAQALSVAIFPTLAALAAKRDMPELRKQFSLGLRFILFLTVPSAVLIIVLAVPITAILFQRGRWTWDDTLATASATVFLSLSIFAVSAQAIVTRGFYAMQNTLAPMVIGTVACIAYLVLNWLAVLVLGWGTNGLAISYSVTNIVSMAAMIVVFRNSIGGMRAGEVLSSVSRVVLASLALGVAAWAVQQGIHRFIQPYGPGGVRNLPTLLELALCSAVGGAVYLALVKLLRVPEAEFVFDTVRRKLRRR